ncbi:MAG: adenylate kinase [Proteobacteria bacterium]|nr:adenylate kinase [Pseudomonadota bacterium]
MHNLLLMGPPGAGKGTQGITISKKYSIPVISTGDILRANVKDGTELGKEAKGFMDRGELVSDSLVLEMVASRLADKDCANGFILDGFPRNTAQAEALAETLTTLGKSIDLALGIEVASSELVRRLCGRRVCSNKECGRGYHIEFAPSAKEGLCDECGSELYHRADDKEETIKARLKVYEEQTRPLVDYYSAKGLFVAIEGVGSVDAISGAIIGAIEERSS